MRHMRRSTWILIAVFLLALVTYLLVRPAQTAATGHGHAAATLSLAGRHVNRMSRIGDCSVG
jgi:hypothetical protein